MAKEKSADSPTEVDLNGKCITPSCFSILPAEKPEFDKFCSELKLPEDIRKRAWGIWHTSDIKQDEVCKAVPLSEWFTCVVYMALVDARMPYGPNDPQLQCGYLGAPLITVTELLKKSQLKITKLFERMHTIREYVSCRDQHYLSEAVQHDLINLEKKFCIDSALFHTFQRLCGLVFRDAKENRENSSYFPEMDGTCTKERLCWTLFLHAKGNLMMDSELVYAFQLLLCCMEYVLRTTPSFQLNFPFDSVKIESAENLDCHGVESVDKPMLKKLSEQFNTSFEELYDIHCNCTESLIKRLPHTGGVLDLTKLEELYLRSYRHEGDFNELLFLQYDSHLQPAEIPRLQTSSSSADHGEPPMTPVRAALNTVQQLKNILSSTSDEPSGTLREFFSNCATNPTVTIANRLNEMKQVFIEKFVGEAGANQRVIAEQRLQSGIRLYYRVMAAMLQCEQERLSQTDFSTLLNNDTFHRSLLACALEIVIVTYDVSLNPSTGAVSPEDSHLSFPWVLEVFNLHSYDFYKVLESFIKAEPKLTSEIIKHLQNVETHILECDSWKEDSPLFGALAKCEVTQCSVPPTELTNTSTAELYLSPMKPSRTRGLSPGLNGFNPSPRKKSPHPHSDSPTEPKTPKRSQSLNMFFNKVCRLGYHKLQSLCTLLDVPKDLQHKIWTCFEYCITHKPGLMKNRHIDQILMCSIYGVCKVVEHEIKFRTIVQMYRDLPRADQTIFKHVLIEGEEFDSIIIFYNKIFMHNLKNTMLQFSSNKQLTPSLSPVPKTLTSPLQASPVFSIPGRKNFFVSPLKQSPFKMPPSPSQMTPRSRQLYSFGEGLGSSEKLRFINDKVSAFRSRSIIRPSPKHLKRLKFEQMDDDLTNQNVDETGDMVVKKQKLHDPPPVLSLPQSGKKDSKSSSQT
ncbi:hypothetical protein ScPMuIL_017768 [Solemya velum]